MTPDELKRTAVQKLIEAKRYNKEQFQRFFTELYKIEEDAFAPVKVAEAFKGLNIPDIRVPGQGLEDRWPHYFICKTDPKDADFADYQPDSPMYKREFQELVEMTKAIRARADEINKEAMRLCELQSQGGN